MTAMSESAASGLTFEYEWLPVLTEEGKPYLFPGKVTSHLARNYAGPAVYRWAVWDSSSRLVAVYLGEAEEFPRRLRSYLRPGRRQKTSIRVKQFLEKQLVSGSRAELSLLRFRPFRINGCDFRMPDLRWPAVRKMIENLLLFLDRNKGAQVLNRALSDKPTPEELRSIMKYLKTLSSDERSKLLKHAESS